MDFFTSLTLLGCFIFACFYIHSSNSRRRKFPPGPYPFPIIGNILQIGKQPHRSLAKLANIYGPIMYLKLGSVDTIVISSSEMAKSILQKHEYAFTGRPQRQVGQILGHSQTSVVFRQAGDQWHKQRAICKEEMFSITRLDASEGLRQRELRKLRDYIKECSLKGKYVDITQAIFSTTLNMISNTLFSIDFAGIGEDSSHDMHEIVRAVMELWGAHNLADYFPILKLVDIQGIKRNTERCYRKFFEIFDGIIDERLAYAESSFDMLLRKDFLEALLFHRQRNPSEMSREVLKHLLLDIFIGGIESTSSTVGWAMTELLRNPDSLSKAKTELNTILGHDKDLEESDISNLPYLQAVIKETFRYHSTAPLIPRCKDQGDPEINGYKIPENAQILVNVWAIHRDSSVWSNPDIFEPDRFIDEQIDTQGQHFKLIPFSSGRRICLGMPLANRMIHSILASLIHKFDWKLEEGVKPEDIDISERFGLTLEKAVPLWALPS